MFYFALCFKLFDRLFLCYFQFPPLTFILEFYGFGKYRGKASGNVNVCVHCFSFPFASLLDREKFPNLKFNLLFENFFFRSSCFTSLKVFFLLYRMRIAQQRNHRGAFFIVVRRNFYEFLLPFANKFPLKSN